MKITIRYRCNIKKMNILDFINFNLEISKKKKKEKQTKNQKKKIQYEEIIFGYIYEIRSTSTLRVRLKIF